MRSSSTGRSSGSGSGDPDLGAGYGKIILGGKDRNGKLPAVHGIGLRKSQFQGKISTGLFLLKYGNHPGSVL